MATNSRSSQKRNPAPMTHATAQKKKKVCPQTGEYLTKNDIYKASITTTDNGGTKRYIDLVANSFVERYRNHTKLFTDKKCANETELSKYVWMIFHIKLVNRGIGRSVQKESNVLISV